MAHRPQRRLAAVLALIGMFAVAPGASAATLISAEEANLPPAAFPAASRGITRGPTLKLESPTGPVSSPFKLIVTFTPHGGAQIALASVKLTYLRNPAVDLTGRIKAFVTQEGLGITAAEVPTGKHELMLEVADTDARVVRLPITLVVEPPK